MAKARKATKRAKAAARPRAAAKAARPSSAAKTVRPVPSGYHTVTAYLTVNDGARALEFYKRAFGASESQRMPGPGGKLMHAEFRIGDSVVMLSDEFPGMSSCKAPTSLGGTRHLSAAQFVHDQRDGTALVASQDGRFTVFAWSPCEDMVHAHRVEALLM